MGTVKYTGPVASFRCPTNAEIRSLKVHFSPKQEGSGNPSPENVRPIAGWDGVEVSHYDDMYSVPSNYQRVEYIRIRAYSYFDSNYVPTVAPKIITKIQIISNADADLFGFANNVVPSFIVDPTNYGSSWYQRWGATNYTTMSKQILKPTICEFGQNQIIDGTLLKTFPNTDWSSNTQNIRIGGARNFNSDMNLYYCDIYDGTNLVRRLVPCRRKSDDVLGLYDMVNENFLTNQGTATLDCGSNVGETVDYEFETLGKNKFNKNTITDYCRINASGQIVNQAGMSISDYIPVIPNQQYVITTTGDISGNKRHAYYDKNKNYLGVFPGNSTILTIAANAKYIRLSLYNDAIDTTQLELGSTATAYEPYDPNHTVYGGWVDLISGEVCEEYNKIIADGVNVKVNRVYDTYNDVIGAGIVYLNPEGVSWPTISSKQNIFSDNITMYNAYGDNATRPMPRAVSINAGAQYVRFYVGYLSEHPEITTNADKLDFVNSYLQENPVTIVYELKNYKTYHFSPTQLQTFMGHNNIWSNADYVEVEYDLHETEDMLRRRASFIMANQPHLFALPSASVQNFTTDLKAPLKECKVHFSPVQSGSGTPSPDNDRPITGWTGLTTYYSGENLYIPNENNKGYISGSGVINVDTTSTYTDLIPVTAGGTYSFKCTTTRVNEGNTNRRLHGYDSNGNWVRQIASKTTSPATVEDVSLVVTIPSDVSYIRVSFRNQDTNVRVAKEDVINVNFPSVINVLDSTTKTNNQTLSNTGVVISESGMSVSDYIKVTEGSTYTLSFLSTEGPRTRRIWSYNANKEPIEQLASASWATVNATGSIQATIPSGVEYIRVCYKTTDGNVFLKGPESSTLYGGYLDLVNGELVQEWYNVDPSKWIKYKESNGYYAYRLDAAPSAERYSPTAGIQKISNMISEYGSFNSSNMNKNIFQYPNYVALHQDIDIMNLQYMYKLAEPVIYQLTPAQLKTLRGANNIWSTSNGSIDISYWKH